MKNQPAKNDETHFSANWNIFSKLLQTFETGYIQTTKPHLTITKEGSFNGFLQEKTISILQNF